MGETGVPFPRASKRPSNQLEVFRALRDLEQRAQIKRILPAEKTSREIQESGINPDKTSLNSISSFGSRSEQISASRKPLFLDTTLCLKEPAQETMIRKDRSPSSTPQSGGWRASTSPPPRRWRGNLPPESSSPGSLTGLWRRTPLTTPP